MFVIDPETGQEQLLLARVKSGGVAAVQPVGGSVIFSKTDAHRDILFGPQAQHTTLTRAFTGRLARGVRNGWTDAMGPRIAELPPFPVTGWFVSKLRPAALAAGRTDLVSLWSGQIAPNLRHRSAAELMQSLLSELYPLPQEEEVPA